MGYEINFVPSAEAMENYKQQTIDNYSGMRSINDYKIQLAIYCLSGKIGNSEKIEEGIFNIKLYLNMLYEMVKNKTRMNLYNRWKKDNEVWFCGWEYSNYNEYDTKDEYFDYVLERLSKVKYLTADVDYYDEKFNDKEQDINEILEYFIDCIEKEVNHEFCIEMKGFEDNGDDDEIEEDNNEVSIDMEKFEDELNSDENITINK